MIEVYKAKLLNRNKKDVISIIGDGMNYYHLDVWIYLLEKTWWERKKILYLHFDENDTIDDVKIIISYF